jgi:S-adenosylmethionine:tRNA ribosyltransferase-isomerase
MQISEFDYELPSELIAQHPLKQRDASRMLVVDRKSKTWLDSEFSLLPDFLRPHDALVLNNTRVFPARLIGRRDPTGGLAEVLLVHQHEPLLWDALIRPGHRLNEGSRLRFGDGTLSAEVVAVLERGLRRLRFAGVESLEAILDKIGETPLPPYIKRLSGASPEDRERYQTVYASRSGAVAAPTAGLHFTQAVLDHLKQKNIENAEVTLHVGYGTFEPVRVDEISEHRVAPELFEIDTVAARTINQARLKGGRIVAVGTTTTRALESAVNDKGEIESKSGSAAITITPGFEFRGADALITNFHLPRSSLLLLVSAFAGRELILNAYRHAVQRSYRFYSYGDCMLIL